MSSYINFKREISKEGSDALGQFQTANEARKGSQLIYPMDLFTPECSPFIIFVAVSPTENGPRLLDKLALYMPKQLQVNYGLNYGEAENYVAQIDSAWKGNVEVGDWLINDGGIAAMGAGALGGLFAARGAGARGMAPAGLLGGLAGAAAGLSIKNPVGQQLNIQSRKLFNPHMAVTFEGIQFRKHDFSFDLVARNEDESKIINDIIYVFKYHAHPEALGPDGVETFYQWPSNWNIGLFSPSREYLFNITTAFLANIHVDYAAGGQRAFFAGTGAPVSVRLSLTFIETELVTRNRIRQGY
jgi:hypothetical protein